MLRTVPMTLDEIECIIASTYHQYRAEPEEGSYRTRIKTIHKKLNKAIGRDIDIEFEIVPYKIDIDPLFSWTENILRKQGEADAKKES